MSWLPRRPSLRTRVGGLGRFGRLVAALAVLLGSVAMWTAPAGAEGITIRKVDTTRFPKVTISALINGKAPGLGDFHLRENGRLVDKFDVLPITKTDTPVGIVLVVDVSGSMAQNDKLGQAKVAAKQFVAQKQPGDQIAVEAFANQTRLVQGFTTNPTLLNQAIDGLTANGETALWDGVGAGASLLRERPDLQANMVLLSDGKDTLSTSGFDAARSSVLSAHAAFFAIGLEGGDFEPGPLQQLAATTGGTYQGTADPRTLGNIYGGVQRSLQNQYEISYRSTATGTIDLDLSAGGYSQSARGVTTGTVSQGAATRPETATSSAPGFLKSPSTPYVVGFLVLVAAGLAAYAVILMVVRDSSSLEATLQPYDAESSGGEESTTDVTYAETAIVQRAVAMTAKLAEDRGLLPRLEGLLERADLPLRAAEALFFYLAAVVVFAALGLFVTRSLFGAIFTMAVVAMLPMATLKFLAARRRRRFTSQLPDMLQLLSGSMRAGYSLLQGVEAVSQEVEEPMGKELRRVLAEARLGRLLEDSLADTAKRMDSPDFDWAVMAIRIQREVGGNLAELLQTVGETMIARERLRREVKALTAEGRISAIVLGILPVGLGMAMYVINPEYMRVLFNSTMGQVMLGGSCLLALFGFWWMKKTIEITV